MTAHTPGPWHVEPATHTSACETEYTAFLINARSPAAFAQYGLMGDYRGCTVAHVEANPAIYTSMHRDEFSAERARVETNARLIAAAPALLAACQAAREWMTLNPDNNPNGWQVEVANQLFDALALAAPPRPAEGSR